MARNITTGITLAYSLTAPQSFDATGWGNLSVSPVGEFIDIEFSGSDLNIIDTADASGNVQRFGTRGGDYGTATVNCYNDPSDTGQAALRARSLPGLGSHNKVWFKVSYPASAAGGSGIIRYFEGSLGNFVESMAGSESAHMVTFTINVNDHLLDVSP